MATLDELLGGPDGKTIKAYVDQRVSGAIKTFATTHPGNTELTKRVAQIERTAAERIRKEKLATYFVRSSYKAGIDPEEFESLGIQFADEADVDAKLKTFKARFADHDVKLRNEILSSGWKPGSGNGSSPGLTREQFAAMPAEDRINLEQTGRLNELIKTWTK